MVTSVRLDSKTERALDRMARRTGRTKSNLIREAVQQMATSMAGDSEQSQTAYDRLVDIVGIVNRGPGDRAARSEEILRAKFARKKPPR
jgi:predicted DNA-binding protein